MCIKATSAAPSTPKFVVLLAVLLPITSGFKFWGSARSLKVNFASLQSTLLDRREAANPEHIRVGDCFPFTLSLQRTRATEKVDGQGLVLPADLALLPTVDLIPTPAEVHGSYENVTLLELCMGRKVLFLTVPGAFTPVSAEKHLPSFVEMHELFSEKGIDEIVCLSVNDHYVMDAWKKDLGFGGTITFLADSGGTVAAALGLGMEGGTRFRRSSMLVDDGVVRVLNLEEGGLFTELSGAAFMLSKIN